MALRPDPAVWSGKAAPSAGLRVATRGDATRFMNLCDNVHIR